ncbi:MAG: hypothetical protein WAT81_05245 [Candidatus Moraniibacteriota bacterium]
MTFWEQFWPQFAASIASGTALAALGYAIGYLTRNRIARAIHRSLKKIENTENQ